jgi:hypothetical protein
MRQFNLRLGELRFVSGGEPRLDDVARDEHWPHSPAAGTSDVGSLQSMLRRHQPDDCPMLAMGEQGADNSLSLEPHPLTSSPMGLR